MNYVKGWIVRGKVFIVLMVGLVVTLWPLSALAQAEEPKAQLLIVGDFAVKPSMVNEYEAAVKELLVQCAKHKFPYQFYVYSTDDFHYYAVYPVENFAAIDNWYKAWGELGNKMGYELLEALHNRIVKAEEKRKYVVYYQRPDLSYIPEKPRLKPGEENFVLLEFWYIQSGKEKEFEGIAKEWRELYKSKNIPDGWTILAGDIGAETPIYVVVQGAKSAADYYNHTEKIDELLGEEVKALRGKTLALVKKFELRTGRYRPELSFTPKEE